MADSDSLPEGWTVEVKVRKNGRKDKYPGQPQFITFHSRAYETQEDIKDHFPLKAIFS